ncbi:alcohol dehydrogenase catalytic domain-containing protein [Gordonia aichiensis]|uniref:alcohol dehydrogenase catalytic domain-containing protein n=1 Tax=Gordonia aichiensis TaxID=36820 RepID=UPI003263A500
MSSSTMKAFVMPEVGKTAVVDKPIPDPGPDDVIVKTTHALICTSDVHTVAGVLPVNPGVTLGHEALGVVYATGSNVTGFVEGQRVAVNAITPCFQCRYCQTGYTSQCGGPLGGYKYTAVNDGNLAEYFVVPHAMANLAPSPMR